MDAPVLLAGHLQHEDVVHVVVRAEPARGRRGDVGVDLRGVARGRRRAGRRTRSAAATAGAGPAGRRCCRRRTAAGRRRRRPGRRSRRRRRRRSVNRFGSTTAPSLAIRRNGVRRPAAGEQLVDRGQVEQVGEGVAGVLRAGQQRPPGPVLLGEDLRVEVGAPPQGRAELLLRPALRWSGSRSGRTVRAAVGATVGTAVRATIGAAVGTAVRAAVRAAVGTAVGTAVRATVRRRRRRRRPRRRRHRRRARRACRTPHRRPGPPCWSCRRRRAPCHLRSGRRAGRRPRPVGRCPPGRSCHPALARVERVRRSGVSRLGVGSSSGAAVGRRRLRRRPLSHRRPHRRRPPAGGSSGVRRLASSAASTQVGPPSAVRSPGCCR